MLVSPYDFLRGSAAIMAHDLAATPITGISTQMCGDAHLGNFGIYATPERNLVFDVNDFDETVSGPWEWDVKRLATSIVVVGRQNGFSVRDCQQAIMSCVSSYRERMYEFSTMRRIDLWYARVMSNSCVRSLIVTFFLDLTAPSLRHSSALAFARFPNLHMW
jgi:uncharacterized protein (DUF2252 family)